MLPVFLNYQCLVAPSVFCNLYLLYISGVQWWAKLIRIDLIWSLPVLFNIVSKKKQTKKLMHKAKTKQKCESPQLFLVLLVFVRHLSWIYDHQYSRFILKYTQSVRYKHGSSTVENNVEYYDLLFCSKFENGQKHWEECHYEINWSELLLLLWKVICFAWRTLEVIEIGHIFSTVDN